MLNEIFVGVVLVIALTVFFRQQMKSKIEERTGEDLSRFCLEGAVLTRYRKLFAVDRLYIGSQLSTYCLFALVLMWILFGTHKF